jgi:hypothetical protein
MQSITLTAVVDEKGHLEVDVPLPPGLVEVVIRPVAENGSDETMPEPGTREWIRAKLIAAGLVNPNADDDLEDAEELSEEEEIRLGKLLKGDRPVEDYISEDREERF